MNYFVFFLFIGCFVCLKQRKLSLFWVFLFFFVTFFLYKTFGEFFFSFERRFFVNYWLLMFCGVYFLFWFLSYLFFCKYHYLGIFFHSLLMTSFSLFKLTPPIHPFILLYPHLNKYLPCTNFPLLNCFLIFFISGVIFLGGKGMKKFVLICLILSAMPLINILSASDKGGGYPLRVMVVQVGLYFDKGGNTNSFFYDMLTFINKNPNIELIVFSESSLLSFKTRFNEEFSQSFISQINQYQLTEKYHFLLGFSGYKDINNIVTVYKHKNKEIINQKSVLIPFIEKDGILNRKHPMYSDYFSIEEQILNDDIRINNVKIKTNICYDALFPPLYRDDSYLTVIQSSYNQLNYGSGYNELISRGTLLAKFSVGMHSRYLINIQDHGGTFIFDENWKVNEEIFNLSKDTPFFIIDLH